MRCALLAVALGVIALQQQAVLPRTEWAACALIPLLLAAAAACVAWRSIGTARQIARATAFASTIVAAGLIGFCYAGWRAEARLADELPSAWEGRDIEVIGVVDELPQRVDRGTRFAFAVERVVTDGAIVPSEISLAWYSGWLRDSAEDEVPELHSGERWN